VDRRGDVQHSDGTSITASGGVATLGTGTQGGGSGGALRLDCLTITGGGSLQALGGAGSGTNGNGGGGGRIALRTNNNQLTSDFYSLCNVVGARRLGRERPARRAGVSSGT